MRSVEAQSEHRVVEDQDAVFEEFRQVETAEKKVEGTGLGLTLHGSKIWVTSQVGAGSPVYVPRLPPPIQPTRRGRSSALPSLSFWRLTRLWVVGE